MYSEAAQTDPFDLQMEKLRPLRLRTVLESD